MATKTEITGADVLAVEMDENDANVTTIRGYLKACISRLWGEGEGFSGKRPFGNSGWAYDLYRPLVRVGFVTGIVDQYGDLEDFDMKEADRLIFLAIEAL